MVAHFMESDNSIINQLKLATVSGSVGPAKPGTEQILLDLAKLPPNQLSKEITKIVSGQMPLTCADKPKAEKEDVGLGEFPTHLRQLSSL